MRHGGRRSKFWRLLPVRGEEVASLAAVFSVGGGRRGRRKLGRCLKYLYVTSCFVEDLLVIGDCTVLLPLRKKKGERACHVHKY